MVALENQATGKTWWFPTKPTINLSFDSEVTYLGIYSPDLKTYIRKKTAHECLWQIGL